eukprot:TRINITY_DN1612_c0_g1_i1.p1 TRINITY_DN1612_c0_g1~~TRINITY_DN1612_c0_g1_i1.p1  ORF type:complete len:343 (-),score=68.29 TRINITY_DN1612_c0_g1_i1:69-1049(-)
MAAQFIGSFISLISKSNIRYVGTLFELDTEKSTVTLKNVRSLGTEDRPCNAPIPASNQVYEFIVFSARDISDLKVLDARPQPTPPQDPAIVNAGPVKSEESVQPEVPSHPVAEAPKPEAKESVKKAEFDMNSEFDFEKSNAEFDKDKLAEEFRSLAIDSDAPQQYDQKKSFFDNLDSRPQTSQSQDDRYQNMQKQRELNTETFGDGADSFRVHYHNRGGRGRGRGGYRGRSDGNWRRNNSDNRQNQESGQDQPRPWRPRGRGRGRGGHGGDRDKSKIGGQTVEEIREEVRQAKLHKEQQNSKVDNKEDSPKPAATHVMKSSPKESD